MTTTPEPTYGHALELVDERRKVAAGPYGPEHDAAHGYVHLAGLALDRVAGIRRRDRDVGENETAEQLALDRRAWVEVGQFVLAALELIDQPQPKE